MPSLQQRMRKVHTLLAIRVGSGAAILPKDISRIHLRFAKDLKNGHMGPRKFWQQELVRLKYHNPSIPMTVDRTCPNDEAALLTIHRVSNNTPGPDSPASSPAPTSSTTTTTSPSDYTPSDITETITMTHKSSSEILTELLRVTKAQLLEPTDQDKDMARKLDDQEKRSAEMRALSLVERQRRKREAELLAQARGDMSTA